MFRKPTEITIMTRSEVFIKIFLNWMTWELGEMDELEELRGVREIGKLRDLKPSYVYHIWNPEIL